MGVRTVAQSAANAAKGSFLYVVGAIANQLAAALDDLSDNIYLPDGVVSGSYAFTAGSAVTITAAGTVKYRIAGITYTAEMPATITLEDLGDITQNKYGAWRILIDALGAVTTQSVALVGGHTTAQIALLALSGLAPTASTVVLGYFTIVKTGSAFNIGTDNVDVATSTAAFYYERAPRKQLAGLNAAMSVVPSLNADAVTITLGTVNINYNGLKKAEIAASATQALTDADIISTHTYGNILVLTNLAGTGIVTLNDTGIPGVATMAHATAAAALTASDLVVDRLPPMFVPIALIKVYNGTAGNFTAKTTKWDATSVVASITGASIVGTDRTALTGFNSHQLTRPAIAAATDVVALREATLV